MTTDSEFEPKRPYSTPKLVAYGDIANLTKTGMGSKVEIPTMMGLARRP
jgi:hypothetical protein